MHSVPSAQEKDEAQWQEPNGTTVALDRTALAASFTTLGFAASAAGSAATFVTAPVAHWAKVRGQLQPVAAARRRGLQAG